MVKRRSPRHHRALAAAGIGTLVVRAVLVPFILHSGEQRIETPTTPRASSNTAASGPTTQPTASASTSLIASASTAPSLPDAPANAAPRQLTVKRLGQTATLRWTLATGNNYPLLVQQSPQTSSQAMIAQPFGTTTYTATGLQPGVRYCFRIGAVTVIDAQQAQITWSPLVCATG